MLRTEAGFRDSADGTLAAELLVLKGPTVLVDIGFDENVDAAAPNLPMKKVKALVDTGASDSCIDEELAIRLKLPNIDQRNYSGIGGMIRLNVFLVQIYIPNLKHLLHQAVGGAPLSQGGSWQSVILGRTFLRPFVMRYEGKTGRVVIAERES